MSKQFLVALGIVIVVLGGIFFATSHTSDSSSSSGSSNAKPTEHIQGEGSTGVTLVEYGDYECPYCEEYYPTVTAVQQEYNDRIYYQFRNFPLISVHQNAFSAARAAEAAALQDKRDYDAAVKAKDTKAADAAAKQPKYWAMHDLLYDQANWQQWSTSGDPTTFYNQYAAQIGLNVDQFKKDFASSKVNDIVNADMAAGNKLGITGTPTFFLDGKEVQIPNDKASFEKILNAEIAKKKPAAKTTDTTKSDASTTKQ